MQAEQWCVLLTVCYSIYTCLNKKYPQKRVEANRALLSLKRKSQGVQMTWDEDAMTQVGWGEMSYEYGPKRQKMEPK